MQRPCSVIAMRMMLSGFLVLVVASRDGSRHHTEAHDARHQSGSVCPGFVILPNGFAVLSNEAATPESTGAHAHHGDAREEKGREHTGHAAPAGHASGEPKPLMGHMHGEAIRLQEGMLCVPLGSPSDTAWMAVSRANSLFIMVESLRGALTHNSRDNEGFHLTIMQPGSGQPMDKAQVRLLARMPQHDRHIPGGHGPANDPDVQGLVVAPDATGRYTVQTVDFSMAGPWLFEIQVQQGNTAFSAYFAATIGEQ